MSGPLRLHSLQLHGDGARLRRADPDRKDPATFLFAQDDDRSVGGPVESEVGHGDFDHDEYFPRLARLATCANYVPASQLARYLTCSGVSVSIAIPMLCSLSCAIS